MQGRSVDPRSGLWTAPAGRRPTGGATLPSLGSVRPLLRLAPRRRPVPARRGDHAPTAPGPTCAPMAAPSSLTCSSRRPGTRSRISAARRSARSGAARWCTAIDTGSSPAASTTRWTRRCSARVAVRTFSSGTTCPSLTCSTGLTASAEPRTAAAAPIRPPRRRCSRVSTTKRVRVAAAVVRAASADRLALGPGRGGAGGGEDGEAAAHGGRPRVDDRHDVLADLRGGQPGGVRGARQLGGQVDGDDLVGALLQGPPVGRDEVARRGPRGRDALPAHGQRTGDVVRADVRALTPRAARRGRRRAERRGCRSPRSGPGAGMPSNR